jgi:hypothetical protein
LATLLTEQIHGLTENITRTIGSILEPFVTGEYRQRAVAELAVYLEDLLTNRPGAAVTVAGPEDLLQALQVRLAARQIAVSCVPGDSSDLRVNADHTLLETRLGSWLVKVDEALR